MPPEARCLTLAIEKTLLEGTRWVVFEPPGPALAARLSHQLSLWLESLRFAGRLAGGPGEAWFVHVDPPRAATVPGAEFTVGFAPRRASEFAIYRVCQTLHAARLAPVSPERWALGRADGQLHEAQRLPAVATLQEREAS